MFSLQVSKELTYWQEKRLRSPYWYNAYDPVMLVDLAEIEARLIAKQHEFQLQMNIYQQRKPNKHENLLIALSDAILQAIQDWILYRQVSLSSRCCLTLHAVEPLPLPLMKCLAVLLNIPVYAFHSSSVQDTRQIQTMMDTLSFYLLVAKYQNPKLGMKLVVTVY